MSHAQAIHDLVQSLYDCAEELASEIEARYPLNAQGKRMMENRYLRDMVPVFEARLLLAKLSAAAGSLDE